MGGRRLAGMSSHPRRRRPRSALVPGGDRGAGTEASYSTGGSFNGARCNRRVTKWSHYLAGLGLGRQLGQVGPAECPLHQVRQPLPACRRSTGCPAPPACGPGSRRSSGRRRPTGPAGRSPARPLRPVSPSRRTSWASLPPSNRSVIRMNSVFARVGDELLAVGDRLVDVGAAAELHAEDHVHRVVAALLGQVHDLGVEGDDVRVQGRQAGEDRPAHRPVDDRVGHRPALVHVDDHGPVVRPLRPAVEVNPLGDDGAELRLVVLQVAADRPLPVDGRGARAAASAPCGSAPRGRPAGSAARASS